MLFLWNVGFTDTSREVTLEFYDSSKGKLEKFPVTNYQPYFLATHPLSKAEVEAVASVQGEVELVQRQNLFTERTAQLAKVKTWTPTFSKKLASQFRNTWESEI